MRAHTLFTVALASFLIHFSDATPVAPVDGVLANVVPGGTGNIVGTAAGLVAPASGLDSDRKKKKKRDGLPLAGALPAGIVQGRGAADLRTAEKGRKKSFFEQNLSGIGSMLNGLTGGLPGGKGSKGSNGGGLTEGLLLPA